MDPSSLVSVQGGGGGGGVLVWDIFLVYSGRLSNIVNEHRLNTTEYHY